jgi:hypothetical protein
VVPKKAVGVLSEKFEKIVSLEGELELEKRRRSLMTPRPDWQAVCTQCPGVALLGKSTIRAVESLTTELQYRHERIRRLELEDVLNEEQSAAEKKARVDYHERRAETYEGLASMQAFPSN